MVGTVGGPVHGGDQGRKCWGLWVITGWSAGTFSPLLNTYVVPSSPSAELAASQRRDRDLRALERILGQQEKMVETSSDPREIDIAFHLAVAEASHNLVLKVVTEQLAEIMRQRTWQDFTDLSRHTPGRPELNLRHHRAIYEAIRNNAPDQARGAMLEHPTDVEAMLGVLTESPDVVGL